MSKSFSLEQLTEGIRQRHLGSQNRQLIEKWSRTGLLRGLDGVHRENMSRLLENQASQVLKEASGVSTGAGAATSSSNLQGFTNIAFPIVRRVFGGLIANDLVSIQPMSLPSGLLFYLDYTRGTSVGHNTYGSGSSIYNNPAGAGVRSGSQAVGGLYDLAGAGYSRVHRQGGTVSLSASGSFQGASTLNGRGPAVGSFLHATGTDAKLLNFDPQLLAEIEAEGAAEGDATYNVAYIGLNTTVFPATGGQPDLTLVKEIALQPVQAAGVAAGGHKVAAKIQAGDSANVRRLNELGTLDSSSNFTPNALVQIGDANAVIKMIVSGATANGRGVIDDAISYPVAASQENLNGASTVIPAFESDFGATPSPEIPEIDIKVESIPVVANTRKLRARWSPELAQDLNAYHSLDAEVELTQILSEQIALEIDREILNDLLTQAGAANYYWSRAPGKFVNKVLGTEVSKTSTTHPGPVFRGTVREWYETLVETIIDVANQIHRKTLRGSANFIVVGPDVATILEASVMYKPSYSLDGDGQVSGMVLGADKVGTLSNRFTVYKDPYFPRNKVLVGFKGGSYLETGYVYAPYVPLIVTPTIFAPEDFTPRKGVMTRYGKKMVRSDFYGTVTCLDMNVI